MSEEYIKQNEGISLDLGSFTTEDIINQANKGETSEETFSSSLFFEDNAEEQIKNLLKNDNNVQKDTKKENNQIITDNNLEKIEKEPNKEEQQSNKKTKKEILEQNSLSNKKDNSENKISQKNKEVNFDFVEKVIKVIDAYRKLNDEEQTVARHFIAGSDTNKEDEALVVFKALETDPVKTRTFTILKKAKSYDQVERAFFLMGLDENSLSNLKNLVGSFNDDKSLNTDDKIELSRNLVKNIDTLDSSIIRYVEATESVLAVALGE